MYTIKKAKVQIRKSIYFIQGKLQLTLYRSIYHFFKQTFCDCSILYMKVTLADAVTSVISLFVPCDCIRSKKIKSNQICISGVVNWLVVNPMGNVPVSKFALSFPFTPPCPCTKDELDLPCPEFQLQSFTLLMYHSRFNFAEHDCMMWPQTA